MWVGDEWWEKLSLRQIEKYISCGCDKGISMASTEIGKVCTCFATIATATNLKFMPIWLIYIRNDSFFFCSVSYLRVTDTFRSPNECKYGCVRCDMTEEGCNNVVLCIDINVCVVSSVLQWILLIVKKGNSKFLVWEKPFEDVKSTRTESIEFIELKKKHLE